ncbi:hypothetical protein [Cohnella sp. REN36]|uniref:family 4 glycosyl hydrolase n=1 Tax=Cohnella sp. REN36 TaxID=2887347 RepID=UPI001D138271|nr:hypothetical protein [Cohnella sp. REN36]MCC3372123.1 hypothetical protein [Cohnella sp. REN36]
MLKIVIIGGGSAIWTKNIVGDLSLTPTLHGSEVVLVDIDPQRLESAGALSRRISNDLGAGLEIKTSLDRREALVGADYVIISISVGGNDAWLQDIEIPWKQFNIMQTVGDTIGPGGIFRTFRHMPVMLEIALDIKSICPDAWTIQLTNPMTPLCRAIEKRVGIKMIGYCHGVQDTEGYLAHEFGIRPDQIELYGYGVNHFLFIQSVLIDGKDGMKRFEEHAESFRVNHPSLYELWRAYGLFPVNWDRHPVEFVPFFLNARREYGKSNGLNQEATYSHIEASQGIVNTILGELNSPNPMKINHSYERIIEIIEALHTNKNYIVHVNVRNNGAILNLPFECNVEVPAVINRHGCHPLVMGELPRGLDSLVRRIAEEQELIVEASLAGSRQIAVQAIAMDPLVGDVKLAGELFDAMFQAQKSYLLQFS